MTVNLHGLFFSLAWQPTVVFSYFILSISVERSDVWNSDHAMHRKVTGSTWVVQLIHITTTIPPSPNVPFSFTTSLIVPIYHESHKEVWLKQRKWNACGAKIKGIAPNISTLMERKDEKSGKEESSRQPGIVAHVLKFGVAGCLGPVFRRWTHPGRRLCCNAKLQVFHFNLFRGFLP